MSEDVKRKAPWLLANAEKKRAATVKKLTDAMHAIELDIQTNDNIYPFNGGTVNQTEVCQRAGIKNTLLQNPTHKETTKLMVDKWVADINKRLITGRRNVRKAVTARVDDWKAEHEKLLTSYIIDMHKLEVVEARVEELTMENAALREQITKPDSNVRALKSMNEKASDDR